MSSSFSIKIIQKGNRIYTKIKIGNGVRGLVRTTINAYHLANPVKYKHVRSSKLYDYYEFEGDHMKMALLI